MSGANDSEGGRTSEDSCCATKKERMGSNGCEKVSTHMTARGEKNPPPGTRFVYRIAYIVYRKKTRHFLELKGI